MIPAPQTATIATPDTMGLRRVPIQAFGPTGLNAAIDSVAAEEPLEIRLAAAGSDDAQSLAITMRTPGDDLCLAAGFLFAEGLLRDASDIASLRHCGSTGNVVRIDTVAGAPLPGARSNRNFQSTSSCGVCGKASIEAVTSLLPVSTVQAGGSVDALRLRSMPQRLRDAQKLFAASGGLHAVGLFDTDGSLQSLHEDVGRHNAMDKLIGHSLLERRLPLSQHVVVLSGRASFELLQKAMAAGAPIVAAIGAPSSLAIDLAQRAGITLIGFLRPQSFNVYCGAERIA
jgi:FdhD protein